MEMIDETGTTLWAVSEPGEGKRLDWVLAHARPQPDWEEHRLPLALFDPIPPVTPRPDWLIKQFSEGDVLVIRRQDVPRRPCPEFEVISQSGRDLGRIPQHIAEIVEFALDKGIRPEVSVFTAFWYYPPETALQLRLDFLVWCPPGEFVQKMISFRAGHA